MRWYGVRIVDITEVLIQTVLLGGVMKGLTCLMTWIFAVTERGKSMSTYIDAEELIRWIRESQQMTSKVRAIIAKILVMEEKEQENE